MRASKFFFGVRTACNASVRVASNTRRRVMPMGAGGIAAVRAASLVPSGRSQDARDGSRGE